MKRTDRDARTANLLGALALRIGDELTDATESGAELGASAPAAIATVANYPGVAIGELSRILRQSHSGTVRLVDRLVASGLVERHRGGSDDKRSVALRPTQAGLQRARRILEERRRSLAAMLGPLGSGEREQLAALLEKMLGNLGHGEAEGYVICRLCELPVCPLDRCPVNRGASHP